MPLFDHLVIGVSDYDAGQAIFLKLLEPLGAAGEEAQVLRRLRVGPTIAMLSRRRSGQKRSAPRTAAADSVAPSATSPDPP